MFGTNGFFIPRRFHLKFKTCCRQVPQSVQLRFFSWWSHANQSKDFWIETENEMIRIHVVPRTSPFNPTLWKTSQSDLKDALLSRLAGPCITEVIPVLGDGVVSHVHHGHLDDDKFAWKQQLGLWIGRSRFTRLEVHPSASTTISNSFTALHAGCRDPEVTMQDEQGRAHGGAQSPGHGQHGQNCFAGRSRTVHLHVVASGHPAIMTCGLCLFIVLFSACCGLLMTRRFAG